MAIRDDAESKAPRSREGKRTSAPLGVQVIARAAEILRALEGNEEGLSLGQLAAIVGLPRSTVQRIIAALDQENFVIAASPNGRFRLGPGLVQLARSIRFEIAQFTHPYLEELSRETGETVDLAIIDGPKAVFIDQVQGSHRLRAVSAIGVSFPLTTTANGKALLAALTPEQLEHLRPSLGIRRNDWPRLAAELADIRQSGIAYDREEHSAGISAIGASVTGPGGALAAISIPVPSARFDDKKALLVKALQRCCAQLRELLAGTSDLTR